MKLKDHLIVSRVNDDKIYVMNMESPNQNPIAFEHVAKFFYEALAVGLEKHHIMNSVREKFNDCSKEQVERDYQDFISRISELGLTEEDDR